MPIYEYICDRCGHEFEEMQRITDDPLDSCPKCARRSVHRLISKTSFVLKGSGWYVTDYARKGSSAPAPEHSESSAKDHSAKAGDAESKGGPESPKGTSAAASTST
jgi:putative FmdB family regulatory protein